MKTMQEIEAEFDSACAWFAKVRRSYEHTARKAKRTRTEHADYNAVLDVLMVSLRDAEEQRAMAQRALLDAITQDAKQKIKRDAAMVIIDV